MSLSSPLLDYTVDGSVVYPCLRLKAVFAYGSRRPPVLAFKIPFCPILLRCWRVVLAGNLVWRVREGRCTACHRATAGQSKDLTLPTEDLLRVGNVRPPPSANLPNSGLIKAFFSTLMGEGNKIWGGGRWGGEGEEGQGWTPQMFVSMVLIC